MAATKIFIVAGDVSGDIHAANLMAALKEENPSLQLTAIGGPRMRAWANDFWEDLASQGITGFVEPVRKIPALAQLLKRVRNFFQTEHPDAVIAVDYYGFNYRVLLLAKQFNIPCYYYVTPQVWASRQYRAKRLAALTKKMYVIYPFEPAFHEQFGGNALFLGNPLLDKMPAPLEKEYPTKADADYPWKLGLLPGSRPGEITRLLPVFYQTFLKVVKKYPHTHGYLFLLPQANEEKILSLIEEPLHPNFHFIKETDYKLRAQMDYLLACSGTATLENALLGIPMLVAYKMFYPTYLIARAIIQVRDISLVNILAPKRIVKEFIQHDATVENFTQETLDMFDHPEKLVIQRKQLLQLRMSLGEPGVAQRAAHDILTELNK